MQIRDFMEIQKDRTKSATLAALGTCVIYGFSFMASRIALQHAPAAIMLAIRFLVAMLVMLLLLASGRFRISLKGKPVGRFVATALLSAVFLHEKMSLPTFGWIICSVIGAFIISAAQTGSGAIQIKGILWLLVAVISAAVFYVLSRSTADDFTPFERTFIMMLLGWVCFTAQAAAEHGKEMLPILYLSVISSVVAFMLQNYSVTYLELARITVFENIIPVISVAAGVIFLGEPFSPVQLAGMALILLGVYKVTTSG